MFFVIPERCCLFEILLCNRCNFIAIDLLDGLFHFLDRRWTGHRADPGASTGLVEDVDRLVRQKPCGEIACC